MNIEMSDITIFVNFIWQNSLEFLDWNSSAEFSSKLSKIIW